MTIPVKNFNSSMVGAPTLNGTAGALLAVLDACLVNGFNLVTLDSLVVAGGVLTGSKSGHNFAVDQVIVTAGAAQSQLNGEWRIVTATAGAFTAAATGIADVTGSGTITAKAAPAGWTKPFTGTNKAVYKPDAASITDCVLRVDDTGTTTARVVGYETMSDVDTGSGPYPTAEQIAGGGYWHKSISADSTARAWCIVADPFGFYIHVSNGSYLIAHYFGDYDSEHASDAYSSLLVSHYSTSTPAGMLNSADGNGGICLGYSPRASTQLGSAVQIYSHSYAAALGGMASSGMEGAGLTYPSSISGGLVLIKPVWRESANTQIRCLNPPGIFHTPQNSPLNHLDKFDISNVSGLTRCLAWRVSANGGSWGRIYLDIIGPWR